MQTRHIHELQLRLDTLSHQGAVVLGRAELLRWYGQEKISKGIWRDIQEKFAEIDSDPEVTLFVGESSEGFTLIWGKGLTASKGAWFQPLSGRI